MTNQVKLFAANMLLAAVTFFVVGAAHADATVPAQAPTAKAAVVQYLASVGAQASESYRAAR